ncbi:RNA-directed DNA polymerase, eukaryota, partial [Tanacetum coccineum]
YIVLRINAPSGKRSNMKYKVVGDDSMSSGHFKKSEIPRTGGSILGLLDEVVKVGQVMGYKMEGCISNMDEIIKSQGAEDVNFLAIQETKMENMDIVCVRQCWGNLAFEYVHSDSVGNSGGILCAWDPNSFCKSNATISDYFVIIRGVWRLTGKKLLLIAVYAPHDIRDKQMLWDYLHREIGKWNGEVVIMGDFNEVRYKSDRFGSVFNVHNANVFNSFISNSGLVEVTLGGSIFTWCHKSATKMSKLDRFLVSESLLSTYPNINAITLERYLSDHRPILLRETQYDYGPTPFRFFHHWLDMEGFGNLVEVAWKDSPSNGPNAMRILLAQHKKDLEAVDVIIDNGKGVEEDIRKRAKIINNLNRYDKLESMEVGCKRGYS